MWALYRWRVKAGKEETFAKAWERATKAIQEKVKGAQSGMLLQSRRDAAEFVASSRWDSFDEWLAFMQSDEAELAMFGVRSGSAEMVSAEVLDELGDLPAGEQ